MAKKAKKTPRKKSAPAVDYPYIVEGLRPLATPIEDLIGNPNNARAHGEGSVKSIERSLKKYGQRKPVVVNQNGMQIEAGHGTVEAARKLGWTHVAAVLVDDDESTATGFALADNRTAELSEWDDAILAELLPQIEADDAELYDDLQCSLLLEQPETVGQQSSATVAGDDAGSPAAGGVDVPEAYQVVVECDGEDQQQEVFELLTSQGYKCRVLTL